MLMLLVGIAVSGDVASTPDKAAKDPIVCAPRGESPLGTKIPAKRRCVAKSQWAAEQAEAVRQLNEMRKYVPPPKQVVITPSPSQ